MRKVVDTSAHPGRIVLISSCKISKLAFFLPLGDSDFSTDIHSFRYTKLWEVVLIHNAAAKEALKEAVILPIKFPHLFTGLLFCS